MKTMHGCSILESGCSDPKLNIFYSKLSDGRTFILRQPRKKDSGKQRKAWNKLSPDTIGRYKRRDGEPWLYSINQRCRRPLYRGEVPGIMPLTVEVDGEVVGFCDAYFKMGNYFTRYQVEPDSVCSNFTICSLDKFRGMGVGTLFAYTSSALARHFGCDYILGQTFLKGGMYKIRAREGWKTIAHNGTLVIHKMRL